MTTKTQPRSPRKMSKGYVATMAGISERASALAVLLEQSIPTPTFQEAERVRRLVAGYSTDKADYLDLMARIGIRPRLGDVPTPWPDEEH